MSEECIDLSAKTLVSRRLPNAADERFSACETALVLIRKQPDIKSLLRNPSCLLTTRLHLLVASVHLIREWLLKTIEVIPAEQGAGTT